MTCAWAWEGAARGHQRLRQRERGRRGRRQRRGRGRQRRQRARGGAGDGHEDGGRADDDVTQTLRASHDGSLAGADGTNDADGEDVIPLRSWSGRKRYEPSGRLTSSHACA